MKLLRDVEQRSTRRYIPTFNSLSNKILGSTGYAAFAMI